MAEYVILFFFAVLTVGQGRVTIRDFKTGRAGWGEAQYLRGDSPRGYWIMTAIDGALFVYLCFVWLNGGVQLLK